MSVSVGGTTGSGGTTTGSGATTGGGGTTTGGGGTTTGGGGTTTGSGGTSTGGSTGGGTTGTMCGCTRDYDCPVGEICNSSHCCEDVGCSSGYSCFSDRDCPGGGNYYCSFHCCYNSNANGCSDRACVGNGDCKSGYHCESGCCEPGGTPCQTCSRDSDCPGDMFCSGNGLGSQCCTCGTFVCSSDSVCRQGGYSYCNSGCCS